jgi:ubiquinone/menaquinone biosynthesis C-methylase UbiE
MSFDTLAPHYRWMERVLAGQKLQRCRTEFLPIIPTPQHALLVGEGNGRFFGAFVQRFPQSKVTCVDASEKMLAEGRRLIAHANSTIVGFIHADILTWKPPNRKFDLIVTNFFLDCFPPDQLTTVIRILADAATHNASWLLADFCEPPTGWKKWRARWILASMYLFFRAATKLPASHLTPPDPYLLQNGFTLQNRAFYDWGLLHADLWVRSSGFSQRGVENI